MNTVNFAYSLTLPAGPQVTGEIPYNFPLYLTNGNAPSTPQIDELFRGLDVTPTDYYGLLFNEVNNYQDFPIGMNPLITSFEFGTHQGDQTGREMKIYGVNSDGSEELLLTYTTAGTFPITPKVYSRINYKMLNNGKPNYIKVFGTYNQIEFADLSTVKYPLGGHMGCNIHPYSVLENPNDADRGSIKTDALDMCKKMGGVRVYVDNININEVQDEFKFEMDRQGYGLEQMVKQFHDEGIHMVWCMQSVTPWINATYPDQNNSERVPVFYNADRLNPASWSPYAEIAFQIALRYGSNTNHDISESKSKTGPFYAGSPDGGSWYKRVGLGYLKEIEPYNEIDKWWKGTESYATAEEMAVGMNVIYQRIKDADPNMQVTYPGLAGFSEDILKGFVRKSMELYGRIPVDNYAYHCYPSTSGSQYSSGTSVGAVPELWDYPTSMDKFRTAIKQRLGYKPFDCGETGFDCTGHSPLRAVIPVGSLYTQRQWAGILYVRVALYNAKNGVRRTYHYEWNDGNALDDYTQFSAMGMLSTTGTSPNATYQPNPNLYLLGQVRYLFQDYIHENELSSSPLVDEWSDGVNTMYSLYNPTETNLSASYDLILATGTQIEVIELDFNSFNPLITPVTVTDGKYTVMCIEKPKFIKIL